MKLDCILQFRFALSPLLFVLKRQDIVVNQDFLDLQDTARINLPNMIVRAGKTTTEHIRALSPKMRPPDRSPKEILQIMGRITGVKLADMLKPHDTVGDKVVTRQTFIKILPVSFRRRDFIANFQWHKTDFVSSIHAILFPHFIVCASVNPVYLSIQL